jgi:hypothetical protein
MHFRANAETPPEFAPLDESLRLPSDLRMLQKLWAAFHKLGGCATCVAVITSHIQRLAFDNYPDRRIDNGIPGSGRSPVRIRGTQGGIHEALFKCNGSDVDAGRLAGSCAAGGPGAE